MKKSRNHNLVVWPKPLFWFRSGTATKLQNGQYFWTDAVTKGQLISKCLFGVFNFLQKTKKTSGTLSSTCFFLFFIIVVKWNSFGKILGLKKSLQLFLTFSRTKFQRKKSSYRSKVGTILFILQPNLLTIIKDFFISFVDLCLISSFIKIVYPK